MKPCRLSATKNAVGEVRKTASPARASIFIFRDVNASVPPSSSPDGERGPVRVRIPGPARLDLGFLSAELMLQPRSNELELQLDGSHGLADDLRDLEVRESLEPPDHDLPEIFGELIEQALDLLDDDNALLGAGLGAVDVFEHPLREHAVARILLDVAALATNVATIGRMPVGRVHDLAHRDPHQELPELFPAAGAFWPMAWPW